MATATIARDASPSTSKFADPALLVPIVGAGVLIYLAVLPLFMLLIGSFQAEVGPREFVYTLKNYQNAYASEHTYSTFMNSLIFAAGSAVMTFHFRDDVGMAYRTHQYALAELIRSRRRRAVDSSRRVGVDRLDFSPQSQVRLSQRLVNAVVWHPVAAVQCIFSARHDLGAFGGTGAVGVLNNDGGFQIDGPVAGRVGDDVRRQYLADF